MKTHASKVHEFAFPVLEGWQDLDSHDPKGFQSRYLYKQALGASQMAEAFWVLFHAGQHDASKMIARHLLERVYSARLAKESPEEAIDLIIHDISERIKKMKLFLEDNQSVPGSEIIKQRIKEHETEKERLTKLLGREPSRLDFFQRAERVKLKWSYRTMYWNFSRYIHAGFEFPNVSELNMPEQDSAMLALFAPMDTAQQLHGLNCSGEGCDSAEKYENCTTRYWM